MELQRAENSKSSMEAEKYTEHTYKALITASSLEPVWLALLLLWMQVTCMMQQAQAT